MVKKFKMVGKDLHVTVDLENDVFIPVGDKKENVGKYIQKTVQMIQPTKIKHLKSFIITEKDKAEKQIKALKKQYDEIKDLQDIDESIIKQCRVSINKGSKAFKTSMQVLNKRIVDLDRKNGLKAQIDYLEPQLKEILSDLEQLNKVFK